MACPPHAPPPLDAIHTFNRTQYDGGIRYVTEPAVYCHRCQDQKYSPPRCRLVCQCSCARVPPAGGSSQLPGAIYVFYIKIPRANLRHGRLDPAFPRWQYVPRVHVLAPSCGVASPLRQRDHVRVPYFGRGANTSSFPGCIARFKGSRWAGPGHAVLLLGSSRPITTATPRQTPGLRAPPS